MFPYNNNSQHNSNNMDFDHIFISLLYLWQLFHYITTNISTLHSIENNFLFQNKTEEAEKALTKLLGPNYNVKDEMQIVQVIYFISIWRTFFKGF